MAATMKILEVSRRFDASSGFSYNGRYGVIRSCDNGRRIILLWTIYSVCWFCSGEKDLRKERLVS